MAAKRRLRSLIDQLEERYQQMTEEDTFELDVLELEGVDLSKVGSRLQESQTLSETVKDMYDALKREGGKIESCYHRRINLQQPVSMLPPEILGMIFDLACVTDAFWDPRLSKIDPRQSSINPAWWQNRLTWVSRESISLTCTRWRQVAFQTPSMWSYIHILTNHKVRERGPIPHVSLIRSSISRARSTPLVVSIKLPDKSDGWAEISAIFGGNSMRIRSLYLSEPGLISSLRMHWLPSTPSVCPVLEILRLDIKHATEATPHLDLSKALNLRFLYIDCDLEETRSKPRLLTFDIPPSPLIEELYLRGEISLLSSMHAVSVCSQSLQIAAVALRPWDSNVHASPWIPPNSLALPHLRTFIASVSLLAALRKTMIHLPEATTIQIEVNRGHQLSCTFDCPLVTCFASRGLPDKMIHQVLRMLPAVREIFFRYGQLESLKALENVKKKAVLVAPYLETVWLASDYVQPKPDLDVEAALNRGRPKSVDIRRRNSDNDPPIYPPCYVLRMHSLFHGIFRMAAKRRLRGLIDQLEERYQQMTDEDSFELDVSELEGVDLSKVGTRLKESHTLSETVKDMYDAVNLEQDKIFRCYHRRSNLLQPVSTLPPEILGVIFDLACATDTFWDPKLSSFRLSQGCDDPGWSRNLSTWESRKSISLTCTRWYQIALQTPSMWSYIHILSPSDGRYDQEVVPLPSVVRSSLRRARTVPLTISINPDHRSRGWEHFPEILREEVRQIRVLYLADCDIELHHQLYSILQNPSVWVQLRVLRLHVAREQRESSQLDLSMLTNITVLHIFCNAQTSGLEPPLLALELPPHPCIEELYLCGEISPLSSAHALLRCSRSLKVAAVVLWRINSITFYLYEPELPPPIPSTVVDSLTLPNVHTFIASGVFLAALAGRVIHLPKATAIQIQRDNQRRGLSAILDCPQAEYFAAHFLSAQATRYALQMLPTTRELFFHCHSTEWRSALKRLENDTLPVAPNLKTLWLDTWEPDPNAEESLAALNQERPNPIELRWFTTPNASTTTHEPGIVHPPWYLLA
ncbi:hypothetical protein DL93DRAFT_2099463 [Clavulina sp. PMI_390]|nr:hypothetical protein DL93DRAFT_2099463 [Clavulina sp. PMI_390]